VRLEHVRSYAAHKSNSTYRPPTPAHHLATERAGLKIRRAVVPELTDSSHRSSTLEQLAAATIPTPPAPTTQAQWRASCLTLDDALCNAASMLQSMAQEARSLKRTAVKEAAAHHYSMDNTKSAWNHLQCTHGAALPAVPRYVIDANGCRRPANSHAEYRDATREFCHDWVAKQHKVPDWIDVSIGPTGAPYYQVNAQYNFDNLDVTSTPVAPGTPAPRCDPARTSLQPTTSCDNVSKWHDNIRALARAQECRK